MWTLSAFGDEIDPDLEKQCALLDELGIRYIEVRSLWNMNVLDLDDGQLDEVGAVLRRHGIRTSSIGSPIGKVEITGDFDTHLARFARALHVAQTLDASYIRIFSFYPPHDDHPRRHRDEVLRRLEALTRRTPPGVVLCLENEGSVYGDVPERCLDLLESIGSPRLRLAWDGANFVPSGVRPFSDGYAMLRRHIAYVQVKDISRATGAFCLPGDGDTEWPETVRALHADGFDGFFSIEPHLMAATPHGGFSGPTLFVRCARAFTDLLTSEGIDFQ